MNQFNSTLATKLPYVFEGTTLKKYTPSEETKLGFWEKLILNGSGRPTAKDNSTLMPAQENG